MMAGGWWVTDGWREELTSRWRASWGDAEPAGHLLSTSHRDRWVRFHTLPEAKRYATTLAEGREVARRQRAVLDHLLRGDRRAPLIVVTSWWSVSPEPPRRSPVGRRAAVPGTRAAHPADRAPRRDGRWWRSFRDPVSEDGVWTHLTVAQRRADHPSVRQLLRQVAEDDIDGLLFVDPEANWVLAPYDGGLDVLTARPEERDGVRETFSGWLAARVS